MPPEHVERLRAVEAERAALAAEVAMLKMRKEREPELEEAPKKSGRKRKEQPEVELAFPLPVDPNSRYLHDLASNASRLCQERIQLVSQCRKQASRLEHVLINDSSL